MVRITTPKRLLVYRNQNGEEPFTQWLDGLRDKEGQKRIRVRLRRVEQGNFGDCEPIGEGLSELRMFFGPGYRVYIGEDEENIVILLCGGDKKSQTSDIATAKAYWKEYQGNGKV